MLQLRLIAQLLLLREALGSLNGAHVQVRTAFEPSVHRLPQSTMNATASVSLSRTKSAARMRSGHPWSTLACGYVHACSDPRYMLCTQQPHACHDTGYFVTLKCETIYRSGSTTIQVRHRAIRVKISMTPVDGGYRAVLCARYASGVRLDGVDPGRRPHVEPDSMHST